MKGQKDVTLFFLQQAALERQKAKKSADRCKNKAVREFLPPEEIKQLAQMAKEKRKKEQKERTEATEKK
jgi:hypothetical protein